ncbi:hypothetical protein AS149_13310 [Burkholderia cenocepacia]|nr:hypothetical protein AS149_13310 [Burkholderia cenocepacia]
MRDHQFVQRSLAVMAKGRMSQIVGERSKLYKIEVDAVAKIARIRQMVQPGCDAAGDLGDLEGVRQTVSEEVGLSAGKQLGFALKAAK